MIAKDLLAFLTPEAVQHIKKSVNSKNKADYQKLTRLFDDGFFVTNNFDDAALDILTFDWQSLERDRNWWWQLQALPFLNWYANSFALQSEEEKTRYFFLCLDVIHNWISQAKQSTQSPLVWHDHAAAFRVRNLTNWLVFCCSAGLPVSEEVRAEALGSLVIEHLDWLQEDKHYSKHTNHGFDQAMIALTIGLMFDHDDFKPYRQRNRDRLKDEVTFAFTDEGVHKENSPGYQKMMLSRLKQLRALAQLGEQEISKIGERYIEKAEAFLRAITLPHGSLPMIGDTRGGDKGLPYEQREQIDVLDYSASGYVVVRGSVLGKDFHLVFKASHLSHYHRHDDDLSIHLYFNGKVLLGDGGLGSHNEKEKKRKELRSCLSHNTPYVIDADAARQIKDLNGLLPSVSYQGENIIIGKSHCFGIEVIRELDISQLIEGKLIVRDSIGEGSGKQLAVNFFSSEGLYETGGNLLVSIDDEKMLKITPLSNVDIKERSSFVSNIFSKFSKASSSVLTLTDNAQRFIETELNFNVSKEVLHEISYRGFGPITISEAGNWFFDNVYPGNICHHVMSLRWLSEVKSPSYKARILRSFFAYHNASENVYSSYYLGRNADHTTSIRLAEMLAVLEHSSSDKSLVSLIRKEIDKNIRSCLKETYKEKNNHGLMVDKAILLCLIRDSWLFGRFSDDIGFVVGRVRKQLDGIFDEEGYCKEHSTSYQEYNLGVALDLIEVINQGRGLGFDTYIDNLIERVHKIKVASQKALGFLLKDDGTYFTVGDSFPQPKTAILEKAFGNGNPRVALFPYSEKKGVYYNKTLGVSAYRDHNLHLVMNGCWHSYVHKQNDDLSIYMRVNNEDVFVDGGYSDIISSSKVDTRSELLHSTIISLESEWKSRGDSKSGYSKIEQPVERNDEVLFSGCHSRINNTIVSRDIKISKINRYIEIIDNINPLKQCVHRFLIPENFKINSLIRGLELISDKNKIIITVVSLSKSSDVYFELGNVDVIRNGKISHCRSVDIKSNGSVNIFISY